nr:late embryogenesis abundant protein LEA92 [Pinus tabuliformis]
MAEGKSPHPSTRPTAEGADSKPKTEVLPTESSSPYTNYKDLDDYKMRGYGAEGHVDPLQNKPPAGGTTGTEGPTLAGAGVKEDLRQCDELGRPIG